jgi:hypothetical protein
MFISAVTVRISVLSLMVFAEVADGIYVPLGPTVGAFYHHTFSSNLPGAESGRHAVPARLASLTRTSLR